MEVLRQYDPDMCIMSVDEAYLTYVPQSFSPVYQLDGALKCLINSINDYCTTHNLTPEECVSQIRADVQRASELTCSAGIGSTRMLAKVLTTLPQCTQHVLLPVSCMNLTTTPQDLLR